MFYVSDFLAERGAPFAVFLLFVYRDTKPHIVG